MQTKSNSLWSLFAITAVFAIGLSLLAAIPVAKADDDDDITTLVLRVSTNGFADFDITRH